MVNEWHGISKQCVQCRKATSGIACQSKLEVNTTKWHWWKQRQGIQHKNLITICKLANHVEFAPYWKSALPFQSRTPLKNDSGRLWEDKGLHLQPICQKRKKKNGTSVGIWIRYAKPFIGPYKILVMSNLSRSGYWLGLQSLLCSPMVGKSAWAPDNLVLGVDPFIGWTWNWTPNPNH